MRARLRTWPQRVFCFRVLPLDEALPQLLWDTAHAQQRLWNALTTLAAIAAGQAAAEPTLKKLHWWCWEYHAHQLVARSGLNWECGPDVLDRFRSAMKGIGRNGKGPPRPHYRLDRVRIPHRFTGGGMPVARLFGGRAHRCRLDMVTDRLATLHYGLAPLTTAGSSEGDGVDARVILHRAIPEAAIVKQVALCGVHRRAFGAWYWTLNVTVETPPEMPAALADERPVAGLDFGWRVMPGDYLRIGVLTDSGGHTLELRLPLDGGNRDTRRARIPSRWDSIADYQHAMDLALEDCKRECARSLNREQPGLLNAHALRLMRHRGLRRLLAACDGIAPDTAAIIRAWDGYDHTLRRRCEGLRLRLIAQRRDRYRILARWLCTRYRILAVERDMSLSQLAMQHDAEPALKAAQQYRGWAALSEMRRYITEAAACTGTALVGETAYTSQVCMECGAAVVPGAARVLTCAEGHAVDQDANAARALLGQALAQTGDGPLQTNELRKVRRARGAEVLDIPTSIRAVAVVCSLE